MTTALVATGVLIPCESRMVPGAAQPCAGPAALDTAAAGGRDWLLAPLGARAIPTKEA